MLRKLLAILFFLLSLSLLGYFIYHNVITGYLNPAPVVTPKPIRKIGLTGVIRTTGLRPEEKTERNIPGQQGNYQIEGVGESYYILAADQFAEGLVGRCVYISVPETYIIPANQVVDEGRAYAYPKISWGDLGSVGVQDFSMCSPYVETKYDKSTPRTFTGYLSRETRPAPDIWYDYVVSVPEGFLDPNNASGIKDQLFYNVIVVPSTNAIWKDFEINLGKRMTFKGFYLSGYAESKYLLVTNLNPVTN